VSEKLTGGSNLLGYGKKYCEGGNRKTLPVWREKHRHKGGLKPVFLDVEDEEPPEKNSKLIRGWEMGKW